MQKDMVLRMLTRRGKRAIVLSSGSNGLLEWQRTDDALLIYVEQGKVTIDVVKNMLSLMNPTDNLVIMIYNKPPTPDAKHVIKTLKNIQTFTYEELAFDLIQIVPAHSIVLGPKPKEWTKYPVILTTDIVARYYAFRRGDVIRVEEDDGTLSYKRCI